MKKCQRVLLLILTFLLLPALAQIARADVLAGLRYNMTLYLGSIHSAGGTRAMCFRADGTWDSPTYAGTGKWAIKGSEVWLWGDDAVNNESFAAHGAFTYAALITGTFANWAPALNNHGTFRMQRSTTVCSPPAARTTR